MAFNFFKWLAGKDTAPKKADTKAVCFQLASEIMVRELAFNLISNKIANAVSKCTVNVYENNRRVKNDEWYRWNIQPNRNQSATQFWAKLINHLYENNEALVVVNNEELYVADDYQLNDDSAFFEHYFQHVTVNSFTYSRNLRMSEVFYFKLNSKNLRTYLDGTLSLYAGLINAAYSSYLVANGNKGILKIDQFAEQGDEFEDYFKQLVNEDFKTFFSNANAVLPLFEGYEYKQLENKGTQSTTRDFKALLDDVISLTANAFNVPSAIANGDVQDTSKAVNDFLTFCIDPLMEMFSDEMNRKLFTKGQILKGTYVKFDTKAIKHIDLLDVATAIDKLISSGFTCINDLREICGFDRIDESWAEQFFMTKNYSTVKDLMKALKGGDEDEE